MRIIYYVLLFKNFIILSYINETLFAFNIHNIFLDSNYFPIISPNPQKCENGISCTNSQTCMSNATAKIKLSPLWGKITYK